MKRFLVGIAIVLMTSACGDDPRGATYTYVVTCNFPRETTVDTIKTLHGMWYMENSYRIGDSYYPTAFCKVRNSTDENR